MKTVKIIAAAAAMALVTGAAKADFVLQDGNAASTVGAFNPQYFSFSNATAANDFNSNSTAVQARGNLFTDVSNFAGPSAGFSASPLRTFNWGFRNAGGANGGTAGRGLSSGAGGVSYSQVYTSGSNTGTANYVDSFQSSRSRITANLTYTLTDGATAGAATLKVVSRFTNNAATTETYDFLLMVDSQILGAGNGSNDAVTTSIDAAAGTNSIRYTDTVAGSPYFIEFNSTTPTFWEVGSGAAAAMGNKIISGASATPTNFAAAGTTTTGVSTFAPGTEDPFGGFQYRQTLAPGASFTVTSYVLVNSAIPEPAMMGLLAPAAMLLARRRQA